MGENSFALMTMAMYGIILLMSAIAYFILQNSILSVHGEDWVLAKAVGSDFKGKLSPVFYILGIASSWISSWLAALFYVLAALLWLIPDTRIERSLNEKEKRKS